MLRRKRKLVNQVDEYKAASSKYVILEQPGAANTIRASNDAILLKVMKNLILKLKVVI